MLWNFNKFDLFYCHRDLNGDGNIIAISFELNSIMCQLLKYLRIFPPHKSCVCHSHFSVVQYLRLPQPVVAPIKCNQGPISLFFGVHKLCELIKLSIKCSSFLISHCVENLVMTITTAAMKIS